MLSFQYADINECAFKRCGDDSLCQNFLGGFDCECNEPGHFKVNVNGKCKRKACYIPGWWWRGGVGRECNEEVTGILGIPSGVK